MNKSQVFKIALSPAERFLLLDFSHGKDQKIPDGQEGRRYRRWMNAFGLDHIARILREHGQIKAATARDESTIEIFEVTAENVEYAYKLLSGPRPPIVEDVCGELLDEFEMLRADGGVGRLDLSGELPAFDREVDRERWLPEKDGG